MSGTYAVHANEDQRVTLVMTVGERDAIVQAIDALMQTWQEQAIRSVLNRHAARLNAARIGSWGKRQ